MQKSVYVEIRLEGSRIHTPEMLHIAVNHERELAIETMKKQGFHYVGTGWTGNRGSGYKIVRFFFERG